MKSMIIFPAIDLVDGKAVRLTKGDYSRMDIYDDDPAAVAQRFESQGATHLHIVDLSGARDGSPKNFEVIKKIRESCNLFIQVGGGIRDEQRIRKYLDMGANRVILGTAAIKNPGFLTASLSAFGTDKIVLGADLLNGRAAVNGWTKATDIDGIDLCRSARDAGVKTILCTDISKDGMLQGPAIRLYEKIMEIGGIDLIASGGVTDIVDITQLKSKGLYGAIIGKALYAGNISLADALSAAGKERI